MTSCASRLWPWLFALGCSGPPESPPEPAPVVVPVFPDGRAPDALDARPASYAHAESGACADCHEEEAAAWAGSSHDLALTSAEEALGVFDGQPREVGDLVARPLLVGDERQVEVTDATGPQRYRVAHAFGHAPLQQVLLEGDGGRLLVAPIAWDVAGKRWYDPSVEGAIGDPADPLYWAGLFGTWNHACSSCHSTGVVEGYDAEDGSYATSRTHDDVACEACHGVGPEVRTLATGAEELDTCATCHSLRTGLYPGWTPGAPLLDHFAPVLLDDPTWDASGRLVEDREVFEWGLFLQSPMAEAGVRCTHCHDPHTAETVADGDALCLQCHPASYSEHEGEGSCVGCHAPTETYMGLDERHDHAFGHDGGALGRLVEAGRIGEPTVAPALRALALDEGASVFHRASALALLGRTGPGGEVGELAALVADDEPLIRWQAATVLAGWGQVEPLLAAMDDPIRAVRFAALRGLLATGGGVYAQRYAEDLAAWRVGLAAEGDDPANQLNLGMLARLDGDEDAAIRHFRNAVAMAPQYEPARRALAGALARKGEVDEARAVLEGP